MDASELVGWHFVMLRSFDPEVSEVLAAGSQAGGANDVFWDIGANKGACSIAMIQRVPSLRVVAIEPQSSLRDRNIRNLEAICRGRFEYYTVGVGTESSTAQLTIPDSNSGKASLHAAAAGEHDRVENVQILSACQIRSESEFGDPTLVKIDVEGHEFAVLGALQNFFEARSVRVLVFENHPRDTDAFSAAVDLSQRFGYRVFGVKKTLFATKLVAAGTHFIGITDYAVIRDDVVDDCRELKKMIEN